MFIHHLAAARPLLKTDNISPVCRYIIEVWPALMTCTWKNCVLLAAFWDIGTKYRYFIWAERSTARCAVMVHSERRIALLSASLNAALPSEPEKPSWIDWTIEIFPPHVEVARVVPRAQLAGRVFEWAIMQSIQVVRDDPYAARDRAATCCARPRARHRRSLIILTVCEPMGLSLRRRLLLLASHREARTRERKIPSRIAREIEIFSIFAWLDPALVPEHNSKFRAFRCKFRHTICWSRWSINIFETFGRKQNCNFLLQSCFCSLLRNRSKLEDVDFRRSLALDHHT